VKILIISQWYDPEPTFKGQLFAEELVRRGHDVQVLTGFPNYPTGVLYPGWTMRPFQREVVRGVRVLRVPLYPSHDSSARNRVLNYASFALSAAVGALLLPRPDVAYVYHPPATAALPALVLALVKNVPYVYDVQDLWPDSLEATGMVSDRRVLAAVAWGMRRLYATATRVVVLSPGMRSLLAGRGTPEGKTDVIYNWAYESDLGASAGDSGGVSETGEKAPSARPSEMPDAFSVTFAGNLGSPQGLGVVLDAAELLRDDPGVAFVVVGTGLEEARLRQSAADRGLDSVRFLPRRPVTEIGPILDASDVLLVHLVDEPLFQVTIPSKTQSYLLTGRPVLMGVAGDASELVEAAGAGLTFPPGDATALADAVRRLKAMTPEARAELGAQGRRFYDETLSLRSGAEAFERTFERARPLRPWRLAAKRGADAIGSAAALAVLSLPIAGLAVAASRALGTPVLFRQERPGRHGEPFEMVKFRTMNDARGPGGELLPDGARLTRFGSLLRSTSLDELPSLVNVLRGDMSFVGPRPLLMRYTRWFTAGERRRLDVRPGITGLAQVSGRNTTPWDERLAMDVEYVRGLSLRRDLRLLVSTLARVTRRSGVVVDAESVMQNLDDERRDREARS
jgi:lipopolysaccharide/colanic/teichoic acid biosynthesis glycosyltransferase